MADFSSALYLGMQHASCMLPPWGALTTGRPPALQTPPAGDAVAGALARLIGCEQATLGTSTLHIYFDLFEVLAESGIALCIEAGAYPVARWGVERMAARGVPVLRFRSAELPAFARQVAALGYAGLRPVVVADGLCPATGRPAPLASYLEVVRARRGWLVIDDTQALGILGERPTAAQPYGQGGGGSAALHGLRAEELVVVSSLAKGFGVPLAVLAGNARLIARYESRSPTRVHCSGPSAAHLAAAGHAFAINSRDGARLRERLVAGVRRFRRGLQKAGLAVSGACFPVQTPALGAAAEAIHAALVAEGIVGVLHQARRGLPAQLSFLITAAHQPAEIDRAAESLLRLAMRWNVLQGTRGRDHGQSVAFQA